MNRSQSKYFATAAKMDDALLELLEQKDFAYITVKEICAKAVVNRSTFYLHYETISDLLNESVERINREFLDYMKRDADAFTQKMRTCPVEELYLITPEYLEPYLGFIKERRRVFRTVVEHPDVLGAKTTFGKMMRHVFSPIMDRYGVPMRDRPYLMAFYISGLMAIIAEWIKGDCADSIDRVVALIQACVKTPEERL